MSQWPSFFRRREERLSFSGPRATIIGYAGIAQLVEHQLPKLRVAGSSPVGRSIFYINNNFVPGWRNWQTRMTQDHVGFTRAGSNPASGTIRRHILLKGVQKIWTPFLLQLNCFG